MMRSMNLVKMYELNYIGFFTLYKTVKLVLDDVGNVVRGKLTMLSPI